MYNTIIKYWKKAYFNPTKRSEVNLLCLKIS